MGVKRDQESAGMSNNSITEDEAALYDRQIRLWGLECQRRLRQASILVVGLNGLGAEVVKNLTLSGVKSITILDETPVKPSDFSANFFVIGEEGKTRAEASKEGIQQLNPNVQVEIEKEPITSKSTSYFESFTAVVATELTFRDLKDINAKCREAKVLFFCGNTWGLYGYCFLDLMNHRFSVEITVNKKKILVKSDYCSLATALEAKFGSGIHKKISKVYLLLHALNHFEELKSRRPNPDDADHKTLTNSREMVLVDLQCPADLFDNRMLRSVYGELSPVCAAVGGVLANEIVKGISSEGQPVNNFLLFDGNDCCGTVETVKLVEEKK